MSSSHESIARWNKYKTRLDTTKTAVIRAYLYLIRPKDGFPSYSPPLISALYDQWKDEENLFYRMTTPDEPPKRTLPKPPYGGEQACWRMWALLIQQQVEGSLGQLTQLKECVAEILANPKCLTHSNCSCKVPSNPWIFPEELAILEPLKLNHNPKCRCDDTRYRACKENDFPPPPIQPPPIQPPLTHDDTLFGHTAPMFVCQPLPAPDQERFTMEQRLALPVVHSPIPQPGTTESLSRLLDRIIGVNDAAIAVANASLPRPQATQPTPQPTQPTPQPTQPTPQPTQPTPQPTPFTQKFDSFVNQVNKAQAAIDTAAKASGGIQSPNFAKELFAAMGTPHDSKCPHGLPFYSCMPCSH